MLKQQAVLFRASHHSGPLEVELTRLNIPFVKFGGLKFLDAAHIKDMLALPRFAENPRDRVAGFRVMQLMPGVGPASAQRVLDRMMEAADPIGALAGAPSPPRAGAVWTAFVETVTDLNAGRAGWPAELERARLWYEPHLDRIHEDSGTRHADLIQLEQIANGYPSRERFLTELTHFPYKASNGITYHPHPNGWSCNLKRLQQYDCQHRLHFPSPPGGALRLKMYADESLGERLLWITAKIGAQARIA